MISFRLGWEVKTMRSSIERSVVRSGQESRVKAMPNEGNQIEAWKSYTNYQYGFSLKYPENSMPGLYVEGVAFDSDPSFPGVRIISFYRNTADTRYLESGTKTFSAFNVTLLPAEQEEKYANICEKTNRNEEGPLLLPCPPLKIDARSDVYVMYLDNFNQDQPEDALSDAQIESIRSTLKAF